MARKKPLVATQPAKLLFTIYFILTCLLKVPFNGLRFLLPSQRQNPRWSWQTAFMTMLSKRLVGFLSRTRTVQPRMKEANNPSTFATALPASADLYRGVLAHKTIKPGPVNGIWLPSKPPSASTSSSSSSPPPSDFVILHFHGGAYVMLSPDAPGFVDGMGTLVSAIPSATYLFAPEYRLASWGADTSFPAQLQDALTSYAYLLHTLSIPASQIVVSGDSAGGHLALSLLRYLHQNPTDALPLPRTALLHSPWLNLTSQACKLEVNPLEATDHLATSMLEWGTQDFVPREGVLRDSEWISPLFHPFECKVPLWVQDGTAEVLHPDIVEWVGKMKERGTRVDFWAAEGVNHDVLIIAKPLGFSKERDEAFGDAARFLKEL